MTLVSIELEGESRGKKWVSAFKRKFRLGGVATNSAKRGEHNFDAGYDTKSDDDPLQNFDTLQSRRRRLHSYLKGTSCPKESRCCNSHIRF